MTGTPFVRDLFEIPEHVRTSDFVSVLTRDVDAPERTAESYVPTPALVDAFDRALDLVGHALSKRETRGAVLHGSFGSGKSHFMAMLSLMIQGHEAPWRLPELHPLRDKHRWVGDLDRAGAGMEGKRLFELHVHMLGKASLEEGVFGGYVSAVKARHPEAPLPAVYADQALFENAKRLRQSVGDEAFFRTLNEAVGADGGGLKKRKRWTPERFDATVESSDPTDRRRLFDALVRSYFPAFVDTGGNYLPFGPGLDALTEHAKDLGYDGLVLFLDELILWLATEKVSAINEETPKIGILGEHDGAIPIVSFIAQQRGLDEMVGDQVRGEEQARLQQLLHFWEDRFDHLKFENKNLPAVIEKRLLRPKNDEARQKLAEAFKTMQRRTGRAYSTLVAGEDTDAFQKLYPFSPALVETLVSLSGALSRHRTAIKLLAEILVDHIPDLKLGELVLLGDVFDVLHDDMADGMLRHRLRDAKKLYGNVLPVIQAQHGTMNPERCQRLRSEGEHRRSLGCSGCPERPCRSDNRLIKSLLLAALVPEAESLRGMTAARLAELNQGGLHVALKGTEVNKVVGTLQKWSTSFPEIHVGEGNNPRVWVELGSIDIEPILQQAHRVDNVGHQKEMLTKLLLEAIGIDGGEQRVPFHEVRRPGKVRFGNVRTMGEEQFRCEDGHEWQLLIDYPFDDPGHGPAEDEAKIESLLEREIGEWTLVWLPSFLSAENERHLRDLVRLEEILRNADTKQQYLGHLGHEKRAEAERVLAQHQSNKKRTVLRALEAAYGVRSGNEADLDPGRSVERHLWLLQPASFSPRPATSLRDAYEKHIQALLAARYPAHPELGTSLTVGRVDELARLFDDAAAAPDRQVRVTDKKLLERARKVLEPLGVALVREDTVHVHADTRLRPIEQTRQQKNVEEPTVEEIITWADPEGTRGLRTASAELVAALFVRAYASWEGRTFVRGGERYDPSGKKALAPDVRLRQSEMPSPVDWEKARKMGTAALGMSASLNIGHRPDNIAWFAAEVRKVVDRHGPAAAKLPTVLQERMAKLGVTDSDRLVTARSADELCAALANRSPIEVVSVLAGFEAKTSATAVLRSLLSAEEVVGALGDDLLFGYFERLDRNRPGAGEILDQLAKALRQDELQIGLVERLRHLANAARQLDAVTTVEPVHSTERGDSDKVRVEVGGAVPDEHKSVGIQPRPLPDESVVFTERMRLAQRQDAEPLLRKLAERLDSALSEGPVELEVRILRKGESR